MFSSQLIGLTHLVTRGPSLRGLHLTQEVIREQLAVSRGHLTPELSLRLLTSECPGYSAPASDHPLAPQGDGGDPWWAIYWPGGQVLARAILDNPSLVSGKTVLDLGSGCGAVSLAARVSGAKEVIANDIDENAKIALKTNSDLNNSNPIDSINFSTENYLEAKDAESLRNVDLLLIGDMFYDQEIGEAVLRLCKTFRSLDKSKNVLLGDPGRWFLESSSQKIRSMFDCVAKYSLTEQTRKENYGFHHGLVWKMK